MSHSPALVLLTAALLGAVCASPAAGQDEPEPYARCAALNSDAERLACFDETYARSAEMRAERERQQAETREGQFGLPVREQMASGPDGRQNLEQDGTEPGITAKIAAVSEEGRRAVVQLDNGQVWRETDGSTMRNRVREGWTATITRHWSGAYEMRFAERSGYLRVARVH